MKASKAGFLPGAFLFLTCPRLRCKNKDKILEKHKNYYQNNKEKRKEYHRQYREKNKEKREEYSKVYKQSPAGIKSARISHWKFYGVIHDNYDELYERYLNTEFCELCNIKFTEDKTRKSTTRCLDHDHNTGEFRNVVCHSCNVKVG